MKRRALFIATLVAGCSSSGAKFVDEPSPAVAKAFPPSRDLAKEFIGISFGSPVASVSGLREKPGSDVGSKRDQRQFDGPPRDFKGLELSSATYTFENGKLVGFEGTQPGDCEAFLPIMNEAFRPIVSTPHLIYTKGSTWELPQMVASARVDRDNCVVSIRRSERHSNFVVADTRAPRKVENLDHLGRYKLGAPKAQIQDIDMKSPFDAVAPERDYQGVPLKTFELAFDQEGKLTRAKLWPADLRECSTLKARYAKDWGPPTSSTVYDNGIWMAEWKSDQGTLSINMVPSENACRTYLSAPIDFGFPKGK